MIDISNKGYITLLAPPTKFSPAFNAPENEDGTQFTKEGDIFSIGACIFAVADYFLEDDEEPALSDIVNDFIERTTAEDPAERPTAEALKK